MLHGSNSWQKLSATATVTGTVQTSKQHGVVMWLALLHPHGTPILLFISSASFPSSTPDHDAAG